MFSLFFFSLRGNGKVETISSLTLIRAVNREKRSKLFRNRFSTSFSIVLSLSRTDGFIAVVRSIEQTSDEEKFDLFGVRIFQYW